MALELNIVDKKILSALDSNCRAPLSALAKGCRLSKSAISNRIKLLEAKGIIKGYYTVINSAALGYFTVRTYLRFQSVTPEQRKEITGFLIKEKSSWWVGSVRGNFDLAALFWIKDIHGFKDFWGRFLIKYRPFIRTSEIKMYTKTYHYAASYFLEKRGSADIIQLTGAGKQYFADETDLKVLNAISNAAKLSTVELAKATSLTPMIIKYRLKKLLSAKVIQAYRVLIDHVKLGYVNYKLDFYLNNTIALEKLRGFVASRPQTMYFDEMIGGADLEAELMCASQLDFEKLIENAQEEFPNDINHVDYLVFPEVYKISYFPKQ